MPISAIKIRLIGTKVLVLVIVSILSRAIRADKSAAATIVKAESRSVSDPFLSYALAKARSNMSAIKTVSIEGRAIPARIASTEIPAPPFSATGMPR